MYEMEVDEKNLLRSPRLVLEYQRQQRHNLPENIWNDMLSLHKRLTTAIPNYYRDKWIERVNSFYTKHFNNV